jgi:hypothetical protein
MAEQTKTPLDLLSEQTALLAKIQEEIKLLRADQIRIALDNEDAVKTSFSLPATVGINNFNMPFMALVGLLVKIALASIPAALVLGGVYFICIFLVTRLFLLR